MKFDNKTIIPILKNFSTIKQSMIFYPGNIIGTLATNKAILAKAKVDIDIPKKFIIYDMPRFLSILSLMNNPDITIEDTYVLLKSTNEKTGQISKVKYIVADLELEQKLVPLPSKDIQFPPDVIEFSLHKDDLLKINKVMDTLSLPEIAIFGEEGKLTVQALNSSNLTQDLYELDIGKTDYTFGAIIKGENLKILPLSYNIKIAMKKVSDKKYEGLAYFNSDNIEYWIALEQSSYME